MMAFMADFISAVMNQASFALQKSAHRDLEQIHRNEPGAAEEKGIFSTDKGMYSLYLMAVAALLHIWSLANADLTLLAVNASTGIIANIIFSTKFLGDKFVPKYDLPGLILIGIGSTMIVLLSNKVNQSLTVEQLLDLLIGLKSIAYLILTAFVCYTAHCAMSSLFK